MNLKNILSPNCVCLLKGKAKEDVILELVDILAKTGKIPDVEKLKFELFYREQLMSTGIGFGLGIPHVRIKNVGDPIMAVGIQKEGISDYESIDNHPVKIVILIIVEKEKHKDHVKLLAQVMRQLKDEAVRKKLIETDNPDEIYGLMTR